MAIAADLRPQIIHSYEQNIWPLDADTLYLLGK